MSFFDSISQALGTDGGNSGLLPSVSNALGTDGSKNGLLNDPVSMAALAIGTGVYFAPELGLTASAPQGLSVAASDTAFNTALANSAVADATTTAAAAGSGWSWGSIGSTAAGVGKAILPGLLGGSGSRQGVTYAQYPNYATSPRYGFTQDNGTTPKNYQTTAGQSGSSWIILAAILAAGVFALKASK
jgi:hypothetical protein